METKTEIKHAFKFQDAATFNGAQILAKHIEEFWAKRGYKVITKVVLRKPSSNHNAVYGVQTDMRNGWPTKKL